MKINNTDNFDLSNINTADVAYLLLIFIIIISLICTDKIYGVHLPHSESPTRPEKSSVRVVLEHNLDEAVYRIGDTVYSENDLQTNFEMYDNTYEFIIVADKDEPSKNIKNLIKILQNNGIYKIAFMTD